MLDIASLSAYIPPDRRRALARGESLPDRTQGAALFADISGFTPLTKGLAKELGPRYGAETLTHHLNTVYSALIAEVDRYGGSVIGFSGDAITCWFDAGPADTAQVSCKAVACGLAMQQVMSGLAAITTLSGLAVSLAIKVAVASGPARRFLVGDPQIQYLDVLAGATLDRLASVEKQAAKGEVLVSSEVVAQLGAQLALSKFRVDPETGQRFAVVTGLTETVAPLSSLLPAAPSPANLQPTPPNPQSEELTEAQIRPWLLPLIYKRLKSSQSQFLAEIRPAVALFLRFSGLEYDQDEAAGEKLDAYIRWVQNILVRYEAYLIQLTHGDKRSYLYAAFGAPLAHEDDPIRAVAAALKLQSPPPSLNFIHQPQIGLSRGRMCSGAYGSSTRCTYGVLGDEVNIAARLMARAKPGQILVSQRVAARAIQHYHFDYMGPVAIKGHPDPLSIFLALAERPVSLPSLVTRFTTPLVGRDQELTQLERILTQVIAGHGQIVRLEGVAGVGKSRLVAALAKRAVQQRVRVVMGASQSAGQEIAYAPWRQIFRALFVLNDELLFPPSETIQNPTKNPQAKSKIQSQRPPLGNLKSKIQNQIEQVKAILTAINPDWLVRLPPLGDLLGLPIPDNPTTAAFTPQLRQETLFGLAGELLQTWAQGQPLLLLIEDAQWLDEASLVLTSALSRVLLTDPILLVLVHWPPAQPLLPDLNSLPAYQHLSLTELRPPAVAALVSERLQGPVSTLALAFIHARTHGNPFFVEELVNALHETGKLQRQTEGDWNLAESIFETLRRANCLVRVKHGQWTLAADAPLTSADLGLPDSIHGLVLSRLDRLPEAYKLTLKVASVIGPAFAFDLLAEAHPLQPAPALLLPQIRLMQARDLVREETPAPRLSYVFKHHLIQEVIYKNLLAEQQRDLHRAVGETQERLQPEAVEQLAYHYSRSGLRDKTLFYLDKAAKKAQREYANETALNYYNQALALEERWEWQQGQVEVLHILGRRKEEAASLQALRLNPAAPDFEVAYLGGQYHEALGDYAQAQIAVERALAISQEQDHFLNQVRCLAQLGLIARRQGDYNPAKAWYQQALALFQDQDIYFNHSEAAPALAQALNGLGIVHRQQGEFNQAKACYEQALSLSRISGNRRDEAEALNHLGSTAYYQRHFIEALTYWQQALEIRQVIGDRSGEGTSLLNLSQVTREMGDYSQAERYLSQALVIQQAIGNRWEEINIWNDLGIVYQELGELARAQTYLERGLQLSQEIGDEAGQAYLLCNLGLVMHDRGDLAAAVKLLADGLTLAQAQDDRDLISSFFSYLSLVSLKAGDLSQAIAQGRAALALRGELDLRLRTADDLATLAAAHLAAGNLVQALDYAHETLAILRECKGEGPEFPPRDYFICYQALVTAGQTEIAHTALQAAYDLVMARAEKISNPALRQSFLEQHAVNREIVAEYKKR